MIIENINQLRLSPAQQYKYFHNGTIIDTNVLLIIILDNYVSKNPDKKYCLKNINITTQQILCVKETVTNLRINKLIITPHIFAETINRIRKEYSKYYEEIKKCSLNAMKRLEEIHVNKNDILDHDHFLKFGNDISLFFATEKQIEKFSHTTIISFDGRFLQKFYNNENDKNILAINLGMLQYFSKV